MMWLKLLSNNALHVIIHKVEMEMVKEVEEETLLLEQNQIHQRLKRRAGLVVNENNLQQHKAEVSMM